MSRKLDYKEQIKSPKWQKRRLEILKRDNFTCQICGETEKQLHVHHTIYLSGKEIWDYNDYQLITLCEDCHKAEHELDFSNASFTNAIKAAKEKGITNYEIDLILFGLEDLDEFVDSESIQTLIKMRKRRRKIYNKMYKEAFKEYLKREGKEP